ncbi:zinc finger CCCH domain-containing protein 3 [Phalaenopsis equestris]|uniref:zinc finger CCCH domain-containing protein 3 n=1 Tax=Phalaenopsis equestris TaxID=78828 RepID=UPI0009E4846E|nr:zinc finger CCCH domain-containing protein 3 [Phalaenopsis equestris]
MPLGKYYCDYCDKQFQDTPAARKRHLSGVQHQRNRTLWYDSVKETQWGSLLHHDAILDKGVCHHFVRLGSCKYGDTCKYYHPTQNVTNATQVATENQPGCHMGISWGDLPPSLRPPPDGGYPPLPSVGWG